MFGRQMVVYVGPNLLLFSLWPKGTWLSVFVIILRGYPLPEFLGKELLFISSSERILVASPFISLLNVLWGWLELK